MDAKEDRPEVTLVELRCPNHQIRLLLKIGTPVMVEGANLIEVACRDCRNDRRRAGEDVALVVHLYNVMGDVVETVVTTDVRRDAPT